MADIRVVTDRFSVAPQIALEDFAQLASAGYRHIINTGADGRQEVMHLHLHVMGGPRPWLKG